MPLQLPKLQKVSSSSIFAEATFFPPPCARLIHYRAERRQWNKWSSRCESSLCESILMIHYWCCICVIRTSLLHYAYQVHGEYHHLPTLIISMGTFWPLLELTACGTYRTYSHHKFLFLWKHRFLIESIPVSQWHLSPLWMLVQPLSWLQLQKKKKINETEYLAKALCPRYVLHLNHSLKQTRSNHVHSGSRKENK